MGSMIILPSPDGAMYGAYPAGDKPLGVATTTFNLALSTPGRLGFYLDYSELGGVGTHTFYVIRTHGSAGAVSADYASSGDAHTTASGTITFADGEMGVKQFTVDVPTKTVDGDHRITVTLSNPTGGAVLHNGSHTVAYGVIDDGTVAADADAVFFDADAVTNGTGTQASPYDNIYDAIANVGSKRYIYGKGTTTPDGTNVNGPYSITVDCINAPAARTSEATRLYIRNWPGFTCLIDGGGAYKKCGIIAKNGAQSYITYRGIDFARMYATASAVPDNSLDTEAWAIYDIYNASERVNIEYCDVDDVYGYGNIGAYQLYGNVGGKVWRCNITNIDVTVPDATNTAAIFTYDAKDLSIQRCTVSKGVSRLQCIVYHKRIAVEGDTSTALRFNFCDGVRVHYGRSGGSGAGHTATIVQNNVFKGAYALIQHQTENQAAPGGKHAWSNNVLDTVGAGETASIHFQTADDCQMYNNIHLNCRKVWAKWNGFEPSILVEYADYNHEHGTTLGSQRYEHDAVDYSTAAALCTAEGFACNDATGDPMFVDAVNGDYTLDTGSPCIAGGVDGTDQGVYLTGVEVIGA